MVERRLPVLPERTPVPLFDLVLVGATGDLALRKLFPPLRAARRRALCPRAAASPVWCAAATARKP